MAAQFASLRRFTWLPLLLVAALITGGGTNPDCEARYVLWGNPASYSTMHFDQEQTDEADLANASGRAYRWYGDDQSRLFFYSWPWALGDASASEIRGQTNAVVARRVTWPTVLTDPVDGYTEATLPIPCDAYGCAPNWGHVKSIDIGHCSVFVPHEADPLGASGYVTDMGLADFSFGDLVLEKLLEELDGYQTSSQGADIYLRITNRFLSSWWVSPNGYRDEVCFDLHAETRIARNVNCGWQPIRIGVCGTVSADSQQQLVWNATRSAGWRSSAGTFVCRNRRQQVVDGVITNLTRDASHSDGHNELTRALRKETASMVLEDVDLIAASQIFDLMMPRSCSNPETEYNTPSSNCTTGSLAILTGYCYDEDPASVSGRCHFPIPIERVEHDPQGIELIVAEQHNGQAATRLARLLKYDTTTKGSSFDFRTQHCSAANGESVDTMSRSHERISLRTRRVTHLFRLSAWDALD